MCDRKVCPCVDKKDATVAQNTQRPCSVVRKEIEEILTKYGLKYNEHVINLMLGTMATESDFGKYDRQLGGGPAVGPFQMEPNTKNDIIKNFIEYKRDLKARIKHLFNVDTFESHVVFCRLHYLRVREAVPTTLEGYAGYWKCYYNTPLGKGTPDKFMLKYRKYVQGK